MQELTQAVTLSAGSSHSLALRQDGTVWAWGLNAWGQLGDGTQTSRDTPVQVKGLTEAVAISSGAYHSLAVSADGSAWAWGSTLYSKLGIGVSPLHLTPARPLLPCRFTGMPSLEHRSSGPRCQARP